MKKIFYGSVLILVLLIGLFGGLLSSSQDSDNQKSTLSPQILLTLTHVPGLPTVDFSYIKPEAYSIVYLVSAEAVENDDFFGVEGTLTQMTKARVATSMDDLNRLDEERPIEALIVHPSGYEIADLTLTGALARRGVVMVTVNMYMKELAALRGANCDKIVESPFEHPGYYLVISSMILAVDPAEQANAENAWFNTCEQMDGVYTISRASQSPLREPIHATNLTGVIARHVDDVKAFKATLMKGEPTLAPAYPTPTSE